MASDNIQKKQISKVNHFSVDISVTFWPWILIISFWHTCYKISYIKYDYILFLFRKLPFYNRDNLYWGSRSWVLKSTFIIKQCQGVRWSYIPIFSRFCYISYICIKFPIFHPKILYFSKTIRNKDWFWVDISYKHDIQRLYKILMLKLL